MHIPDGYLSPITCGVLYGAALPFWYVALQRLKRLFHTRVLPLVSVFAAFSFVVMMFNLPLPGGTTGHPVGVAIGTIVLGPWAAMLAVSVALTIQALLFSDGGVLTLGANCFNMAIAAALVAYGVYRGVAGRTALTSRRRIVAGALAGYAAINVSALLTGVELGLQPLWFKDASGAPLYAPYPLSIAVPAMLIGHLTLFGLAEAFVTGGLVAYLQRNGPDLLERTAPARRDGSATAIPAGGWRATRPLWIVVALLLILTPLGVLAAGNAWGEWDKDAFTDPEKRAEVEAASGGHPLPEDVPAGLEQLSEVWTAPIPNYAPPFLKSKSFGYLMAAMLGVGAILAIFLAAGWVAATWFGRPGASPLSPPSKQLSPTP